MPAWFYIFRLKSGRLYPGATTDLHQRYAGHRAGKGGQTTSLDPPIQLAYSELYPTFAEARQREAQVKRWSAQKKEALIASDAESLRHLSVSHD